MIKKVSTTLIIFILFLLSSCNNLIEGNYGRNELSFGVGDTIAESISKAVTANEQIKDTTEFTIECELLRGDKVIKQESKTAQLSNLHETTFDLNDIPNGNNYFISLKISYGDYLLYTAKSDVITLNENAEEAVVNLQLVQNNSIISYNLDDGEFIEGTRKPISYFVTSTIKIPEPVKAHYKFDGWYSNSEFTGEKIVELGKNRFLGNVTLYAKWVKLNQVSSVTISPDKEKIDSGDKIKLTTLTEAAVIHYTTDGSEPTVNSAVYNKDLKLEIQEDFIKNDKVTIKAIAIKDGMDNSSVTVKEYTRNRYTVTFDSNNGGTSPNAISGLKKGDSLTAEQLKAVQKENHEFLGWYDGTEKVEPLKYKVTKDVKLVAKWIEFTSSVVMIPENSDIDYSDTITLSGLEGAKIYYTLDGSEPTEKSSVYKDGIKFDNTTLKPDNDVLTVRAFAKKEGMLNSEIVTKEYRMKRYTITFDKNGHGVAPKQIPNLKKTDKIAKPVDLTESGFIFGGWYTTSNCSDNELWDFEKHIVESSDITLYAKWTAIGVKVEPAAGGVEFGDEITMTCWPAGAEIYYTTDGTPATKAGTKYTGTLKVDDVLIAKGDNFTVNAIAVIGNDISPAVSNKYSMNRYTVIYNKNGHGQDTQNGVNLRKDSEIILPDLTQEKMNFKGWILDGKVIKPGKLILTADIISKAVNGIITFNASWEGVVDNVTFSPTASPVDYSDTVTLTCLTPGATIYYTTDGITEPTATAGTRYTDPIPIDNVDGITIKARAVLANWHDSAVTEANYTVKKDYTVTFDANSRGTAPKQITGLKKTDKITEPQPLTAENFIFGGWYKSSNCLDNEKWNFNTNTIETSNITLYAKWTELTVTTEMTATDYDFGDVITLSSNTPGANIYYTVDGTTPTELSTLYKAGELKLADSFTLNAIAVKDGVTSKTLTKQYTMITYEVSFSLNGHGETVPDKIQNLKKKDSLKTKKPADLTAKGYIFGGWYLTQECADSDVWNFDTDTITGNVTLYAKWTPITYTVRFNKNDTAAEGTMGEQTFTYDVPQALTQCGFTKADYNFAGWFPTSACNGEISYADKFEVSNLSTTNGGVVDLYAKWVPKEYTIVFNANSDTGIAGTMSNQTFQYTETKNLTACGFTRRGYKFIGWNTQPDGQGTDYANEASVNQLGFGTINLYAKWEKLAPGVVLSQTAEVAPTGINIKWTNPDVDDLAKIIITCVETNDSVEVTESTKLRANTSASHLITLSDKSKTSYTFKIHAVDAADLIGAEVTTPAIKLPVISSIGTIREKGPSHSKSGIPFDVIVTGSNFTAGGVTASSFAVDTPNIQGDAPSVTVKSDTELTLHLFTPETAVSASQAFTINYNGEEKTGNFSVREYVMGDIVLADGSVLSGSSAAETADQAIAVAVIFRAKSGDQPALGVGLKEAKKLYANQDTTLHGLKVESSICIPDDDKKGSAITTGFSTVGQNDMVGSDNFSQIIEAFKGTPDYQNKTDEEIKAAILQQSPALDYVDKYKDAMNIPNNGYETGWFIPSIAELCEIAKAKTNNNLNTNIANAGGIQLKAEGYGDMYWSSSQYERNQYSNRALRFYDNWISGDGLKHPNEYFTRPIHQF